jgi:hypothetical protein
LRRKNLPLLENVLFEKKAIKLPKESSLKYIAALTEKHDLYFGHDLNDPKNEYTLKKIYDRIIISIENSGTQLEEIVKNWPIIMKALKFQGRDPPNFMTINIIYLDLNLQDIIDMTILLEKNKIYADPLYLNLRMDKINEG